MIILPTPEEYARMSWNARTKAVAALLRSERLQGIDEGSVEWARAVQDEARVIQAAMPKDPHASEHRAAVFA